MSALEELTTHMKRIEAIELHFKQWKHEPMRLETSLRGIVIATPSQYRETGLNRFVGVGDEHDRMIAIVRETMHAEMLVKRAASIRTLAAELESLRAVLPGLAARAAIKMGATAQAMVAELTKED